MKVAMHAGLSQQLNMSPQLLQSIRFLRLSATEIDEEVRNALDQNLMLEPVEADSSGETPGEQAQDAAPQTAEVAVEEHQSWEAGEPETWARNSSAGESGDYAHDIASPESASVRESILKQCALGCESAAELQIAETIVDNVDDNGYLGCSVEEICDRASTTPRPQPQDVEQVLWKVQRLEPAGYAARDLSECLYAQLEALPVHTRGLDLAMRIVSQYLHLLGEHDYEELARVLASNREDLRAAEQLILSLDAKPGHEAVSEHQIYVIPEVSVRRHGDDWRVENTSQRRPRLRINESYEQLLQGGRAGEACAPLKQQLQEARWLLRGLEMRQDTLLRTTEFIFERQRGFLEQGDIGMKPLTLLEVANAIGMHESTVSRITTNKYVQTPRGVFELKYFFSAKLRQNGDQEVSGAAVRAMVRKLIEREDAARPLCDGTIATLLSRRGVKVARRTVAKYRDSMNIASAKLRKTANAIRA